VAAAPFFRQVPFKWNDAEKWIAGRHVVHSNPIFAKKPAAPPPPHAPADGGKGRVAPEFATASKGDAASCDNDNPTARGRSAMTELSSKSSSPSSVRRPATRPPPPKRLRVAPSVSMRDVGTEMTPVASQEQSRSGTPAGAGTPLLSPLCSVPSSPRFRGALSSASSFSALERDQELREERCGRVSAGDGGVGRGEGADGPEGGGAGVLARARRGWGSGQRRSCGCLVRDQARGATYRIADRLGLYFNRVLINVRI
jgi:hypothetical protein